MDAPAAVARLLVTGCVGEAAAHEFLAWAAAMDLPDTDAILARPFAGWFAGQRPDRVYVTLQGVVTAALGGDPATWTAAVEACCAAASETSVDPAVPAVRTLIRHRPPGAELPAEVTVFAPVLSVAGLLTRPGGQQDAAEPGDGRGRP